MKEYHLTCVNISRTWYDNDPFILAYQAQQIFFVHNTKNDDNWRMVQNMQHRCLRDIPKVEGGNNMVVELKQHYFDHAYEDGEPIEPLTIEDMDIDGCLCNRIDMEISKLPNNTIIVNSFQTKDDFICGDIIVQSSC